MATLLITSDCEFSLQEVNKLSYSADKKKKKKKEKKEKTLLRQYPCHGLAYG
jgi:hypothetical protein